MIQKVHIQPLHRLNYTITYYITKINSLNKDEEREDKRGEQ